MAMRMRKPIEANDGSYGGKVLAAFDQMPSEEVMCSWCEIDPPTPGYYDADQDPICKGCYDDAIRAMGWDSEAN